MKLQKINHVGIVVNDAKEAMTRYSRIYGIKKWYTLVSKDLKIEYKGKKCNSEVNLYFGGKGFTKIELIETKGDANIYTEYFSKHGEAVHHFQYNVKNLADAIKDCEKEGLRVLQDATFASAGAAIRYVYVGHDEDSVIIELIETTIGGKIKKGDMPFEVGWLGVLTGNYKRVEQNK